MGEPHCVSINKSKRRRRLVNYNEDDDHHHDDDDVFSFPQFKKTNHYFKSTKTLVTTIERVIDSSDISSDVDGCENNCDSPTKNLKSSQSTPQSTPESKPQSTSQSTPESTPESTPQPTSKTDTNDEMKISNYTQHNIRCLVCNILFKSRDYFPHFHIHRFLAKVELFFKTLGFSCNVCKKFNICFNFNNARSKCMPLEKLKDHLVSVHHFKELTHKTITQARKQDNSISLEELKDYVSYGYIDLDCSDKKSYSIFCCYCSKDVYPLKSVSYWKNHNPNAIFETLYKHIINCNITSPTKESLQQLKSTNEDKLKTDICQYFRFCRSNFPPKQLPNIQIQKKRLTEDDIYNLIIGGNLDPKEIRDYIDRKLSTSCNTIEELYSLSNSSNNNNNNSNNTSNNQQAKSSRSSSSSTIINTDDNSNQSLYSTPESLRSNEGCGEALLYQSSSSAISNIDRPDTNSKDVCNLEDLIQIFCNTVSLLNEIDPNQTLQINPNLPVNYMLSLYYLLLINSTNPDLIRLNNFTQDFQSTLLSLDFTQDEEIVRFITTVFNQYSIGDPLITRFLKIRKIFSNNIVHRRYFNIIYQLRTGLLPR